MSEKLPQQPDNEEVDLGLLFNAIGRVFQKLFDFIASIFIRLFSALIYIVKPIVIHIKIVVAILLAMAILGFIVDKNKKTTFFSEMIVQAHFDSKYQLVTNIDYFNALIAAENYEELSNVFQIDLDNAEALVGFDLEPGPYTQNDLFVEYGYYAESVDTSLVDLLSYDEYVNNRTLLSGNLFTIIARSHNKEVFPKLQQGFRYTFENEFSKYQKQIRDSLVEMERLSLATQLSRLDSIQKTYLEVLKNESKNKAANISLNSGIPLQEEKSITKEYDLFLKEQEIRRNLNKLNSNIVEKNTYFDVVSSFGKYGSKDKSLNQRFVLLFPILSILFFIIGVLVFRAFKYIRDHG